MKGLWSVAAVWIKEGPGVGKSLAEWMVHGESEIDLHSSDIARFYEHQKTRRTSSRARLRASTRRTESSTRSSSGRRTAASGSRRTTRAQQALGAVFFEAAGWERPQWYESNASLLEEYGDRVMPRGRVGLALVVSDHQRRAPRDAGPGGDLRPLCFRDLRRVRARCARCPADGLDAPDGRRRRRGRLHAVALAERRLQVRPHHHAARRRALPGRHRWRARHGRPEVVRRPTAVRRFGAARRPHLGLVDARPLGTARA